MTIKDIVSQIHATRALQIKLNRTKRGSEKAKVRQQLLEHIQREKKLNIFFAASEKGPE